MISQEDLDFINEKMLSAVDYALAVILVAEPVDGVIADGQPEMVLGMSDGQFKQMTIDLLRHLTHTVQAVQLLTEEVLSLREDVDRKADNPDAGI